MKKLLFILIFLAVLLPLNFAFSIDNRLKNSIGMEFLYIQPGTFIMGSQEKEPGRDPDEILHKVTLTNGFYMQTTEITQRQWKTLMGGNPSHFKGCLDCPVEYISWDDVQIFIKKLNEKEKTNKYRLPTEAEWEYVCRAGSSTAFTNGDIKETGRAKDPNLKDIGWYRWNSEAKTNEVAKKKPNNWGIYDMHGNLWEWCQDWYDVYPKDPVINPVGPLSGEGRVVRGGGWSNNAKNCRAADRSFHAPEACFYNVGARLVMNP